MSDANVQALKAIGTSTQVTANNIANVNTDDFEPSRVNLESGPDGEGVGVSSITHSGDSVSLFGVPSRSADVQARFKESTSSSVNLGTEMTQLITGQRAFQANISALRTESETMGQLVSELV